MLGGELYIIFENIQFSGVNLYKGLIKDVFRKDKMRVVLQLLDNLTLYDENMYNMIWQRNDIDMNGMSSVVKLEKDGHIQFAIPYSKGWSVYVEGEKRFLEQSSTLFWE